MKLGPIEVIWNTRTSYRQRLRAIVRESLTDMLSNDVGLRAIIARCGRSAAKDYLAELAEPPPVYPADVPADHFEQSRLDLPSPLTPDQRIAADTYLYSLPTEDEPSGRLVPRSEPIRKDNPS